MIIKLHLRDFTMNYMMLHKSLRRIYSVVWINIHHMKRWINYRLMNFFMMNQRIRLINHIINLIYVLSKRSNIIRIVNCVLTLIWCLKGTNSYRRIRVDWIKLGLIQIVNLLVGNRIAELIINYMISCLNYRLLLHNCLW